MPDGGPDNGEPAGFQASPLASNPQIGDTYQDPTNGKWYRYDVMSDGGDVFGEHGPGHETDQWGWFECDPPDTGAPPESFGGRFLSLASTRTRLVGAGVIAAAVIGGGALLLNDGGGGAQISGDDRNSSALEDPDSSDGDPATDDTSGSVDDESDEGIEQAVEPTEDTDAGGGLDVSEADAVTPIFDGDGTGYLVFSNGWQIPIVAVDLGDGRVGWIWAIGSDLAFDSLALQLQPGKVWQVTSFGEPSTPVTGESVDVEPALVCDSFLYFLAGADGAQVDGGRVAVGGIAGIEGGATPDLTSTEAELRPRDESRYVNLGCSSFHRGTGPIIDLHEGLDAFLH